MPRIIPYEQRTSAQVGSLGPGPVQQPFSQGAVTGSIGRALGGMVDDQINLRAFEKQKAEERAAVQAHEAVTATRSRWIEELRTRQESAAEDGAGFAASTLEAFDKDSTERVKVMPTQASRDWLKQRLADVRLGLQSDALAFEAQRGAEYKVNGLARSVDQARIAAEFRPEEFGTLAAEQIAAIEASGLNAAAQAKLVQDSTLKLADASVRGMIRANPYTALKELNDEDSRSLPVRALSFDQRRTLRDAAGAEIRRREAEAKQLQAEGRQALAERVRDATVAYRMGLDFDAPPSRSEFLTVLGAEDGEKAYQAFTKEQEVGAAVSALATASDAEQTDLLKQFAPTGTAGVADAAERYRVLSGQAQELRRQRESDPAGYAARYSPRVQAALETSQDSPEAARAYATATIAEQRRLGVSQPQILPDALASDLAQSFYTQGGEQVAALLQTEQEKWGAHWPQVFGELSAKKLPPAALAIGRGMEPGAAIRLASVAGIPMDELKKGVDVPANDLREELTNSMSEFRLSLDGVVGGENTFASMYDAAERLTYSYLRQGKKLSDATDQAYREVLGDHYAFHEVNGRVFRVPAEHDVRSIELGARRALDSVSMDDLQAVIPTSTGTAEIAAEDYQRAIRRSGYWVTSSNQERGLALFLDGAPVLRKDGSVFEVTWDQLREDVQSNREALEREIDQAYIDMQRVR